MQNSAYLIDVGTVVGIVIDRSKTSSASTTERVGRRDAHRVARARMNAQVANIRDGKEAGSLPVSLEGRLQNKIGKKAISILHKESGARKTKTY